MVGEWLLSEVGILACVFLGASKFFLILPPPERDESLESGGAGEHVEPAGRFDLIAPRNNSEIAHQRRRVARDIEDARRI